MSFKSVGGYERSPSEIENSHDDGRARKSNSEGLSVNPHGVNLIMKPSRCDVISNRNGQGMR